MNEPLTAFFKCTSKESFGTSKRIRMVAFAPENHENDSFTKLNPNGRISIVGDKNSIAAKNVKPGVNYRIEFHEILPAVGKKEEE